MAAMVEEDGSPPADRPENRASQQCAESRSPAGASPLSPWPWMFRFVGSPGSGSASSSTSAHNFALQAIMEDEPLADGAVDGECGDASRDETPSFVPGIRDHCTLGLADIAARAKMRHRRAARESGSADNLAANKNSSVVLKGMQETRR
mmetsp:Transcript_66441/g.142228  ORF Transcript_66441/g.142228 Transcript_66441/m.142228 type:complete len:149 (+) Transcript_66441:61-507(+)